MVFSGILPFALAVYAGGEFPRAQEIVGLNTSQVMTLLSAPYNINPSGSSIGGSVVAIADDMALEPVNGSTEVFVEKGKSGSGQISVYVVRKGDTISEIAEAHGVSVNTILWSNNIKSVSSIREGQELVILPISGVRHIVKSGDTLSTLAKKYKADLEEIISYNNLPSDAKIKSGDLIIIPDGIISTVPVSSYGTSVTETSSGPSYSGYFLRPIAGGKKSQGIHGHNAVDLAASIGTPIIASASGRIIVSRNGGYNGGYGTYVVISHDNGTQTLYAHMNANNVSVGQSVSQGQVIGSIGMTGKTTGPHVHFEVRGAKNPF